MAGGFFRRLFNPQQPPAEAPSRPTSPDVQEAVADLTRLMQDRPGLAPAAALMIDILPKLYEDPIKTRVPALDPEHAQLKIAGGAPILRGEAFEIDQGAFRRRWQKVCAAIQQHQSGGAGQKLLHGLEEGRLDLARLLGAVLSGQGSAIQQQAATLGLDPGLTGTILRLLLIPVLAPINAAGWVRLGAGSGWKYAYCPTCGSWPLLGEFLIREQVRMLRCGLCTASWPYNRERCPFCRLDDPRFLNTFKVPGENTKYWAATCDACKCYLKMVSTLTPLTGPQLLVADLASMYLDVAAPERGYSAPE